MNNYFQLGITDNLNCYIVFNVYNKSVIIKVRKWYMDGE